MSTDKVKDDFPTILTRSYVAIATMSTAMFRRGCQAVTCRV